MKYFGNPAMYPTERSIESLWNQIHRQNELGLNRGNRFRYLTERKKSLHASDLSTAFYTQTLLFNWLARELSILLTVIVVGFINTGYARRMETEAPRGMIRREWAAQIIVGSRWR